MDDFDTFWHAYPRKLAKGDARKAFAQTSKIRPPVDKLLEAIESAKACEQWQKDGGQFIPYPATWLRQERWEDNHEVNISKQVNRPSITCMTCRGKAYTWKAGRCDSCWRTYMGMTG